VANIYNSCIREVDAGGSEVSSQPGLNNKTLSQKRGREREKKKEREREKEREEKPDTKRRLQFFLERYYKLHMFVMS
jgi:hypothetical protein